MTYNYYKDSCRGYHSKFYRKCIEHIIRYLKGFKEYKKNNESLSTSIKKLQIRLFKFEAYKLASRAKLYDTRVKPSFGTSKNKPNTNPKKFCFYISIA